jgi:ABC-2 type transport system ATP-binding protein
MHPAIEVENVGRVFTASRRRIVALEGVSFAVGQGEIVGLLGVNGAGKTTLAKILATLLLPTSGTARVMGADILRSPLAVRRCQSVVLGGERGLYGQLSAAENLRFFAMLDGLPRRRIRERVASSLDEVGLADAAGRKVQTFSRGMRQRLHIAIGMISEPSVMLLDEPTVGLDPIEATRLRGAVRDLRDRGVAVLLTSHYLRDVEELADRVVMLEDGKVTREMTVGQFSASAGYTAMVIVRGTGRAPGADQLRAIDAAEPSIEITAECWQVTLRLSHWSSAIFAGLGEALGNVQIDGIEVLPARLEDAFARVYAGASR